MSTRHLVDPELLPLLDLYPPMEASDEKLSEFREFLRSRSPAADSAQVRYASNHDGHAVRLVLYSPTSRQRDKTIPGILYVHGGGFVTGSPELSHARNTALASSLGVVIVGVDYRLAPEHPHPVPIEDCYAALRWLHQSAQELGVDSTRIAVMGESAGAGLAASLALLARDRGEFPLAFQLLIGPMLDDRTAASAPKNPYVGEFIWTNKSNYFAWQSLLGCAPGSREIAEYAAAARHTQLAGLPPAFIAVGALDLFLDEDIEYAQRLARAGVPIELHVYPGAYHGFDGMGEAAVSKAVMRAAENALRRALKC
jgi:acetyl esterase/lipase